MLVPDASPDPPIWRILLIFTASGEGMWASLFTVMEDPPYFHLDFMVDPPYFHGTRRGIWDSDLCYFFSHERLLGGTWRRPTGWRILLIFTPYLQSYRFLLQGFFIAIPVLVPRPLHLLTLRVIPQFL